MSPFLCALAAASVTLASSSAGAEPRLAFAVAPESDASLASVFGGYRPGYGTNLRLLVQSDGVALLRQSSEISRLQMDNWWAQTGAALIGANLVMQR